MTRPRPTPHAAFDYASLEDIVHDDNLIEAGVRAMLRKAGRNPDDPSLVKTPVRFLRAWYELVEAPGDPAALLATSFDDAEQADEMIVVGPIPFTSVCEHHLLPFEGVAWIGYIPKDGVVGLSKFPRLLEHYARRPQVQERLTRQITSAVTDHVSPDSACVVRATHTCATMRGVRKPAPMTTSSLTGAFRDRPEARAEFLAFTRGGAA